jgi:sugar lactone lactonase YvrE
VLHSGLGILESAIVDEQGRLFFTSQTRHGPLRGALLRLDQPDGKPIEVGDAIPSPGGLAFDADGRLIVGYGCSLQGALIGNRIPRAGLLRIDPDSGERETYATGLRMANGVVRASDGYVYASSDLSHWIERVAPDGTVDRRFARVWSANGLAIDPAEGRLYAAQTFAPAAIARVELDRPTMVTTHARPRRWARAAMPDGLAIDAAGRLYVAVNGAGQIWRVDRDGSIHVLARGQRFASDVALGRGGDGFRAGNLYAVTFRGRVIELPGAVP